jgi:GAF domain-containing protein
MVAASPQYGTIGPGGRVMTVPDYKRTDVARLRGVAMPRGVDWAVELLDSAQSVEDVELALRSSARAAVNSDGATVVRREGDCCYYVAEDAMSPLWCGQRFPLQECISGWAMLNGEIVKIADIRLDPRIPQRAYRPTFVRSLVMVPIGTDPAVGAIGAYWADRHQATGTEVAALQQLAAAAADALVRIRASTLAAA